MQYQQSLARYNDQAATAAANWQANAVAQQAATAASLLKLTADITSSN
jgi:hypothetical protein